MKPDEFVGIGQLEFKDPQAHPTDPRASLRIHSNGISKRELFAAMAMQGLLANGKEITINGEDIGHVVAAIKCADALIEGLSK